MPESHVLASCACGQVIVRLDGPHIYCTACHCDDCQAAAHELEKLPTPEPVMDRCGGTPYVLHRRDRYAILQGSERLEPSKLRQDSPTKRMVARCCNSPMFVAFDNAQHWISVFRSRIDRGAPKLQSRIAPKFSEHPEALPNDVPAFKTFPIQLVMRILLARGQMVIGR